MIGFGPQAFASDRGSRLGLAAIEKSVGRPLDSTMQSGQDVTMTRFRVFSLTVLAMVAFAGNSILCRLALQHHSIDAATFTLVRIISGAAVLWLIILLSERTGKVLGSWWSSLALFAYAAAFSFAYVSLPAASGALLLFGAVQATMIGYGLCRGERLGVAQVVGLCLAGGGLTFLLLPGLSAPPLGGSILMLGAGAAWGVYSLRGRGTAKATATTAGNFMRAGCFALVVSAISFGIRVHAGLDGSSFNRAGIMYAMISGAITSGAGYAIWYSAVRHLSVTTAATVQLSVPVLAAAGGVVLLHETLTPRLVIAAAAILSGVLLVIVSKQPRVASWSIRTQDE